MNYQSLALFALIGAMMMNFLLHQGLSAKHQPAGITKAQAATFQ